MSENVDTSRNPSTADSSLNELLASGRIGRFNLDGLLGAGAMGAVYEVLQENPNYGWIRPLTRAYEYYLIERGGGNGGGIASMNTLSMVWYRHYPESDTFPPYEEDLDDAEFADMLQAYDYVLVWGGDRMLDQRLADHQFTAVHDAERLRLYGRP